MIQTTMNLQQRRQFLKKFATVSLLGSGHFAMNGKMSLVGSALAASGAYTGLTDYKALVCVFLYGGSDSFNMFLPADGNLLASYQSSRGALGIDASSMLSVGGGSDVQFNAQLPNLHSLYDSGALSIVRNAGNLIAPVTRADYLNNSLNIPADLFAHNHQQEQALKAFSSQPTTVVDAGWGGRMADLLQDANQGAALPPTFALNGSDWFSPGNLTKPVRVGSSGLGTLTDLDTATATGITASRRDRLTSLLDLAYDHPLIKESAISLDRTRELSRELDAVLDASNDLATSYNSDSKLASQLRMVARLIRSQNVLGMNRQIFFVGIGGWDTHDNQTLRLDELLPSLDQDLYDFYQTLGEMGRVGDVCTFTASDFGRTLTVNGDGSDHGWGGHYLVMGGGVNGGQLFGQWPSFETGSEDDIGDKGRVIPTLSINQVGGSLARWMGLSESDTNQIFPDLVNFGSDWESQIQLFG